jgi:membrane-associated phospholipid phosphatase
MLTYGYSAMHINRLERWSYNVHQGVSQTNPASHTTADNYLQWTPALAVYGLNLAGIKGKHNLKESTLLFGIATLFQGGTAFGLKSLTKETRPDNSNTLSFPSGHTSTAFANAEFLRMEYKDVSPWYGIAGYAAAATTGYLRMYNNKHWLNDVIAGAGLGILSTQAAYFLYPRVKHLLTRHKHTPATGY